MTVQLETQIKHVIQAALKIARVKNPPPLQKMYEQSVIRQAQKFLCYPTHSLHPEFQLLPSGKRFRDPEYELKRSKHSCLPMSMMLTNSNMECRCRLRDAQYSLCKMMSLSVCISCVYMGSVSCK